MRRCSNPTHFDKNVHGRCKHTYFGRFMIISIGEENNYVSYVYRRMNIPSTHRGNEIVIDCSSYTKDEQLEDSIKKLITHNKVLSQNKIQKLTILNIPQNTCSIPENIGKLESLLTLEIKDCDISYLPESIGQLTNLLDLQIINCNIIFLPDTMSQLKNLSTLVLNNNSLIGEYGGIISESGENNNNSPTRVKYMKPPIDNLAVLWKLTNLKILSLRFNCIQALSGNIVRLSKLEELHIDRNRLTELPDDMISCIVNNTSSPNQKCSSNFKPKTLNVSMNHFDTDTIKKYQEISKTSSCIITGVDEESDQIAANYFGNEELLKFDMNDRMQSITEIETLTSPDNAILKLQPRVDQVIAYHLNTLQNRTTLPDYVSRRR